MPKNNSVEDELPNGVSAITSHWSNIFNIFDSHKMDNGGIWLGAVLHFYVIYLGKKYLWQQRFQLYGLKMTASIKKKKSVEKDGHARKFSKETWAQ